MYEMFSDLANFTGFVERRLLINFRVDPALVKPLLPSGLDPQVINDFSIIGVCLIRMSSLRPSVLPGFIGTRSENMAHRIAVLRKTPTGVEPAVCVPRRDTSSALTALFGSRLLAANQHHAKFDVVEKDGEIDIQVTNKELSLSVKASLENATLPKDSCLSSLDQAVSLFKSSPTAYSPSTKPGFLNAVSGTFDEWKLRPVNINSFHSSYLQNIFSSQDLEFDSAFLMENCNSHWKFGQTKA